MGLKNNVSWEQKSINDHKALLLIWEETPSVISIHNMYLSQDSCQRLLLKVHSTAMMSLSVLEQETRGSLKCFFFHVAIEFTLQYSTQGVGSRGGDF